MANFLNDYSQDVVTNSDYLHSLRLFTKQHYLPDGTINLVENYDPDKGGPVVYYYWSNHYLHSSYNNLVISGLCGIRPSDDDSLVINPLVDSTINYFCLSGLNYHGHKLTVVFDKEGTKYNAGRGLTIYVDGQKVSGTRLGNKYKVYIGSTRITPSSRPSPNYDWRTMATCKDQTATPEKLTVNTGNSWFFEKLNTTMIRVNFKHLSMHTALTEVECY